MICAFILNKLLKIRILLGFYMVAVDRQLKNEWDALIMGIRDTAKVKAILGIPAGETLMSVIAVGKAAVKPIKVPRKPVADVLKTA